MVAQHSQGRSQRRNVQSGPAGLGGQKTHGKVWSVHTYANMFEMYIHNPVGSAHGWNTSIIFLANRSATKIEWHLVNHKSRMAPCTSGPAISLGGQKKPWQHV
jgi:hypothetical protein